MCSEKDDRAPYEIICNFTKSIQELGADVQLVKFNGSPHLGLSQTYSLLCSTFMLNRHSFSVLFTTMRMKVNNWRTTIH